MENATQDGRISARKIAHFALFLALAMILSYVESLIPFSFGIPGVKLGLTNVIVVWMLYLIGPKEAFLVSILRMILVAFLFGNGFSILYSLAGGCLSFLVMWLLWKSEKLHVISISITGGLCHNIGQLMIAALIVENYHILYYVPVLIIAGALTGLLIGLISQEMIRRLAFLWKQG